MKEYKLKYDNLLCNNGSKINSTEIEKELSKKINENNELNKKLENIYNNRNYKVENIIYFSLNFS